MEVTHHLDLKELQSSLLLQIQLLNAGTGIQTHGNLENQRSAHWPHPNKPLNCQNTGQRAQQSRAETHHDPLILSETGLLLHTPCHRG